MRHISSERLLSSVKKITAILFACMMIVSLTACVQSGTAEELTEAVAEPIEEEVTEPIADEEAETENKEPEQEETMVIVINGETISVEWEDNETASALKSLVSEEPISIQMSMYGGFEQVGNLGTSLPRNDKQTTTEAGDIVLYSGNQIVMFYGSNSWSYTRIGKVTEKTQSELEDLLGNGDVTITIKFFKGE